MNCLICRQAETSDGLISLIFERAEMKFVVNNVPARICLTCGEAYVAEAVAERLLQGAEEMAISGELNETREFDLL